jgi:hypothetical protein
MTHKKKTSLLTREKKRLSDLRIKGEAQSKLKKFELLCSQTYNRNFILLP